LRNKYFVFILAFFNLAKSLMDSDLAVRLRIWNSVRRSMAVHKATGPPRVTTAYH
jgi:hypothetical protein